jgi:hypothetical protein
VGIGLAASGTGEEIMKNELYKLAIEGAQAEGKRIRETVEAAGRNAPIDAHPGESENFWLEIDFRDGEVNLTNSWGSGTPAWICEGNGTRYRLDPFVSRLALAGLLEEQPELVAAVVVAEGGVDGLMSSDALDAALEDLFKYWVMDPEDFFGDRTITGHETDTELAEIAASDPQMNEIYLAFTEAEALEWLTERRNEAREELEAA